MQCVGWLPYIDTVRTHELIIDNESIFPQSINDIIQSRPYFEKIKLVSEFGAEEALILYIFNDDKTTIPSTILLFRSIEQNFIFVVNLGLKKIDDLGLFCLLTLNIDDEYISIEKEILNIIFRDFEESFSSIISPREINPIYFDNDYSPLPEEMANEIFSEYRKQMTKALGFISLLQCIEQSRCQENLLTNTIMSRRDLLCTFYSAQLFLDLYKEYFKVEHYNKLKILMANEICYLNNICESLNTMYNVKSSKDIKSILHQTDLLELFIILLGLVTILIDIFKEYWIGITIAYFVIIIILYARHQILVKRRENFTGSKC